MNQFEVNFSGFEFLYFLQTSKIVQNQNMSRKWITGWISNYLYDIPTFSPRSIWQIENFDIVFVYANREKTIFNFNKLIDCFEWFSI